MATGPRPRGGETCTQTDARTSVYYTLTQTHAAHNPQRRVMTAEINLALVARGHAFIHLDTNREITEQ